MYTKIGTYKMYAIILSRKSQMKIILARYTRTEQTNSDLRIKNISGKIIIRIEQTNSDLR